MTTIWKKLHKFKNDTQGIVSVEAMIALPVIAWCFVAVFVFFDAFRAQSVNMKAAYTISDMLTREIPSVDQAFLDELDHSLFDYLTYKNTDTWIRVSVVTYNSTDEKMELEWSRATDGIPPLVEGEDSFNNAKTRIPIMAGGDRVIVVETQMKYFPAFNVGLPSMLTLNNFVVTRPRFAGQLCWEVPGCVPL